MLIFSGPHDKGVTSRDRLLGLTVVVLWGLNFLAIRIGLDHFPPFFFVALRFAVIAIPVLIFIPRPAVRTRWLLLYGTGFGILQFAFLFTAMRTGMPTGLASLVLQSSAPFTVLLGAAVFRDRVSARRQQHMPVRRTRTDSIGDVQTRRHARDVQQFDTVVSHHQDHTVVHPAKLTAEIP